MRSIQNLYDLGDWIGERGQYSGGPNVFASVFLCLPLQGLVLAKRCQWLRFRSWNRWRNLDVILEVTAAFLFFHSGTALVLVDDPALPLTRFSEQHFLNDLRQRRCFTLNRTRKWITP